jgi:hypothetical protein
MATRGPGDARDALYPTVDAKHSIASEARDGKVKWIPVAAVRVGDGDPLHDEAPVTEGAATFAVTDARILLRQLGPDGKTDAAVGHLRYPWIQEVGFHTSTGPDDPGLVRFSTHERSADGGVDNRVVTIDVGPKLDAREIALTAAVKVADFRLATMPNLSDDKRWTLAKLRTPKKPVREEAGITSIRLPGSVHVSADTAIPVEIH